MVGSLITIRNETTDGFAYVYSGLSTTLIGSFALPADDTRPSNSELAIDSNNNLISATFTLNGGSMMYYTHSGISDVITGSFYMVLPGTSNNALGVTYMGGSLYTTTWGDWFTSHSGVSNVITGSVSIGVTLTSLTNSGGVIYGLRQETGDNNKFVYQLNTAGTILGSIQITEPSDTSTFDGGISFDSSGNMLLMLDGDTTATENWTLYKYNGYSNTVTGSVVYGLDTIFIRDILLFEQQVGGPTEINQSDSVTISDTLTKAVTLNKTFSDSSTISDSFQIQDIANTYTISVDEEVTIDDGESITMAKKLSKTFSDSITASDSFGQSKKVPDNRTYIRVTI